MTLYRRILVPLDGSPVDDAVLEHVAALAEAFHSEVIPSRSIVAACSRQRVASIASASVKSPFAQAFHIAQSCRPS